MDGNQNYLFDSKTEAVAFLDSLVVPDMRPDVRQDTVWNELDTLAYDTIYEVHYTRFLPDNLILRSFKEENPMQYLVKSEREQLNRFSLYFSAKRIRFLPSRDWILMRRMHLSSKVIRVTIPFVTGLRIP